MASISNKDYVPGLLRISSVLAGTSNKVPQGEDYCFAQLDPDIQSLTQKVGDKVTEILNQILSFVTPASKSCEYDEVVEASDRCLEHVAITLDNLKNPKKTVSKLTNYELAKPVLPKSVDNSSDPFIPILVEKPNSIVPLSQSPANHPYLPELENLIIRPDQMKVDQIHSSPDLASPLSYIDSPSKFFSMLSKLEVCPELAIDLEHHNLRSYLGFTCLIQISTRSEDFIIDPLSIWSEIPHLRNILTNPNIIKVLHGAESDVLWLQRDFNLHIVNMFDTGQAARKLMFSHFGLGFLLEQLCGVKTDKQFQMADWRVRPLSEDHLKYARIDTHYLLEIFDKLRDQLISKALSLKMPGFEYVKEVFMKSKEICMRVYEKPDLAWVGVNGFELLDQKQKKTLQALVKWRDSVARNEDESPYFVLSGRKLVNIAIEKPQDLKTLAKVVQNFNFVNRYGKEIVDVVGAVEINEVTEVLLPKVFKESVRIQEDEVKIGKKFDVQFKSISVSGFFGSGLYEKGKSLDKVKEKVIKKSIDSIFDSRNTMFFNKFKPQVTEVKRVEEKVEPEIKSYSEQYFIPVKTKLPVNRKPKQNLEKRQKINEKKDIRIGWMDNVELQPVKRKNLFKKK